VTNIVINIIFELILDQAGIRGSGGLCGSDLIGFDSVSGEVGCTSKIDDRCFNSIPLRCCSWFLVDGGCLSAACRGVAVQRLESGPVSWGVGRALEIGHLMSEVGRRKSEVGSLLSEIPPWLS